MKYRQQNHPQNHPQKTGIAAGLMLHEFWFHLIKRGSHYYRRSGVMPSLSQIRDLAKENLKKVPDMALEQKFMAKTRNPHPTDGD